MKIQSGGRCLNAAFIAFAILGLGVASVGARESAPIWQDANRLPGGWLSYNWFGPFVEQADPFIYHVEHGFLHVHGQNTASMSIMDPAMGKAWYWTSNKAYPFLYKIGPNAGWFRYNRGCLPGNRLYWCFEYGKQVHEADLANAPPVIDPVYQKTVSVNQLLTFTMTATDPDSPGQNLAFSLIDPPPGAAISPNGVFTWTPSETGNHTVRIRVTDNGTLPLSTDHSILVQVNQGGSTPQLSVLSSNETGITLRWTYDWPGGMASTGDGYQLEESTTSASTGFAVVYSTLNTNDHQSPKTHILTRDPGQYWYRVRARRTTFFTGWSNVVKATVAEAQSLTRFENNSSYAIISLVVDGYEQFPVYPNGIVPGGHYTMQLAPGAHTYSMANGFWDYAFPSYYRFKMYTVEGSYTQRRGNTETIPFNDPTIQQLLTKFRSTGLWEGSFWVDLTYHTAAFRFYSNRTWRLYVDGVQQSSGSYTLVNRYPDTFSVTFTVGDREGTLYETFGYFTMANGPGNSLIQYFYSGD